LCSVAQSRREVTLSLRKDGEGPVAADIQTPHDVEIVNPEMSLSICRMAAKLTCRSRLKTVVAHSATSVAMAMSPRSRSVASFSISFPVNAFSYTVESARVSALIWTSWFSRLKTNGAVSASDACLAKILVEQLAVSRSWKATNWLRLTHQFSAARNSSIRFCCVRWMSRVDSAFELPES
jgi:DNA-directed RNA polymerase subunit alpha